MQYKIFNNNDKLSREIELNIGDLVTGYNKGYFEVLDVVPRWHGYNSQGIYDISYEPKEGFTEMNASVHLIQKYDSYGRVVNKVKSYGCDIAYISLAKDAIPKEVEALEKTIDQLKSLI
jgi:hypothetical protein